MEDLKGVLAEDELSIKNVKNIIIWVIYGPVLLCTILICILFLVFLFVCLFSVCCVVQAVT